ncbi:penicillin-binding protein 1C [Ancylobacter sp. 6x-1]|uniref:peptidoglycan glycosyltransferase n=1 Tax=Ancylobacter crimeensis TaxID=2579147 RepID=A0ABT0D8L2_9HYPH|nr:penicillin-binding protein 1C [Ancylobacter crimeensis]
MRAAAPPPPHLVTSVEVQDRNARLLRAFPLGDGRWRLAATPQEVDRRYRDLLVAYEDRRFYNHLGVDPVALARAALQMLWHGRIVSGGSTLTMQVARLLEPPRARTLGAKFAEMRRAIELEAGLSKDEILSLYMSLAPYGGNLEGVRAASLSYFGKEPRRLTLGEAALLVAIPQAPESRRPDRFPDAARHGRNRVLQRLGDAGLFGASEMIMASSAAPPSARLDMPALASHAAEAARRERPGLAVHRLAIDRNMQERLQSLVMERIPALQQGVSMALMVLDNATGEVLARVSGADPADTARAGAVDLTRAVRSPGSTLKPFIYGLAFEDGLAHPETLIDDRPTRFGAYAPENFDLDFQGTVPVREALQLSLNVPAVQLLQAVGPQRLATRLASAGTRLMLPPGEIPGLAVGLGGVGIRLEDLAALYADIARGGDVRSLMDRLDTRVTDPLAKGRLLSPVAAWYLAQALAGTPPPQNAAPGLIAFKTGTSFGYRDAWSVGFDGRRTVAVWVGRPDGQPVPGMVGRQVAAPVLFDAFARIVKRPAPLAPAPRGALVARNVELPPPLRRFGRPSGLAEADGPRIAYPPEGAALESDTDVPLALKVRGGQGPLQMLVDGVPVPTEAAGSGTLFWQPSGPGFRRLTVMDAVGSSDSVTVRVH